jgi:hypothetical protein
MYNWRNKKFSRKVGIWWKRELLELQEKAGRMQRRGVLLSFFHHCDKYPRERTYTEEGFILAPGFRAFSLGPLLWAWGMADHHVSGHAWRKKLFTSWQEAKSDKNELGTKYIFPGHVSIDPPPPTKSHFPQFHHHLTVYSDFESINGLIHLWRQSHHDPITFPKPHLWTLLLLGTKPSIYKPLGVSLHIQIITRGFMILG